jgi:hypothetical protein
MDVFLQGLIGYHQNQITNLDIEWEANNEGLNARVRSPHARGLPRFWSTGLLTEA